MVLPPPNATPRYHIADAKTAKFYLQTQQSALLRFKPLVKPLETANFYVPQRGIGWEN
jgi:hypothetical protein